MLLFRPGESPLDSSVLTAVRFDPAEMDFRVIAPGAGTAKSAELEGVTAPGLIGGAELCGHQEKFVFNAGFFDTSGRPLGLLMDRGRVLSRLRRKGRLAEGIFAVSNGRPVICGPDLAAIALVPGAARSGPEKLMAGGVDIAGKKVTAVQAGPVLVPFPPPGVEKPPPWVESMKRDSRCAVGLDASGRVVVVVIFGITGGVTLAELSEILARPEPDGGLELVSAVNLDGGTSAQLSLYAGGTRIDRGGLRRIAACMAVVPREPLSRSSGDAQR